MLKVLQHQLCMHVTLMWYIFDMDVWFGCEAPVRSRPWCRNVEEPRCAKHGTRTRATGGRERQATVMIQESLRLQKSEYVKPYTLF